MLSRGLYRIKAREIQLPSLKHLRAAKVPVPLVVYAILGSIDLVFSKIAFSYGVAEGNPILDSALSLGFFETSKTALTATVVVVGMLLWELKLTKRLMTFTNVGMAALALFHVYGLSLQF